jgi:hypothetical protein
MKRHLLPPLKTGQDGDGDDILFTPMNTPIEPAQPKFPPLELDSAKSRSKRGDVLSRLASKSGIKKHQTNNSNKLALTRGIDAERNAVEGRLREASEKGDLISVTELLRHPVNVSGTDSKLRSALHLASVNGHGEVVQTLLAAGADTSKKDLNGNSPLHLAVLSAQIPVCLILLQHGASPFALDNSGKTPLAHAESRIRMLSSRAAQMGAMGGDVNVIKRNMVKEVSMILDMLRAFAESTASQARENGPTAEGLAWVSEKLEKLQTDGEAEGMVDKGDVEGMIADLQSILDGLKLQ